MSNLEIENIEYSMNIRKLFEILAKNKVIKNTDNRKFTHTSLGHPKGSFEILGDKHSKFMDIYCKVVDKKDKTNLPDNYVYLSEAHLPQGPIIIDIDIKYTSKEINSRGYTYEYIKILLDIYNKYIKRYLNVSDDDFKIYLLEKNESTLIDNIDNDYILKDGVHIIYPFICASNYLQYIIREHVIQEFKKNDYWVGIKADNSIEDILDKAVIERNNWLMYGSCKPGHENNNYQLTRIYNENLNYSTIKELSYIDIFQLPKTLSIRKFTSDDLTELQMEYNWEIIQQIYQDMTVSKKKKVFHDDIRVSKKLVEMLSAKRSENYQQWIELGFCLHNIHESLLELWIEFSKSNIVKYKNGECDKLWKSFRDVGFTIKSLYRWAKEDNSIAFSEFMMEELNDVMKRSLSATSYDVGKAFYELYKYNYVCASIKYNTWYEFKDHRWYEIDGAYTIYHKLNEEMVNEYLKMAQILGNKAMTSNGEDKDSLLAKQQAAIRLCTKIRSASFKKCILNELDKLFYDPTFLDKLDEKRHLICFNNGVYDLDNDIFREGRPEDCITLCTNIDYKPFDKNDEFIKKVENFFVEILPNEDIKNYVLDLMCSCLQGHIPDEKFHIWTGTGGNGKSLSINLLQQALGNYATTLPISMLTNKRPPSTTATPELAKTKGKRFCVFQEPEEGDKIYVGYMKEITSNNDKISARGLFKEPVEFFPQFKLLLTCNNLPDIPATDGGTWRRLRVVPFDMNFVDNPKLPNERKINRKIKDELPNWRLALMSILIKRFNNYKNNGLKEPIKVTQFTSEYQKDSDVYLEFVNDNIVKTDDLRDTLGIRSIYKAFKFWFKESKSDKCNIDQKELKKHIQEKLGQFNKLNKLVGYKLLDPELEDDISEDQITQIESNIDTNKVTIETAKGSKKKSKVLDESKSALDL